MPNLRPTELIIILLIIVLLFGAKKLPELAKSIGQSMKIFRAETKTDDPATQQTVNTVSDAPAPAPAAAPAPAPAVPQAVTLNATAARLQQPEPNSDEHGSRKPRASGTPCTGDASRRSGYTS